MAILAPGLSAATFQHVMELPGFPDPASFQESFRLRAWELHPDVSFLPDSQSRFQELKSFVQSVPQPGSGKPWNAEFWSDVAAMKQEYASQKDQRLASGLVRRIAFLQDWDSLSFLLEVVESGRPGPLWAAIHALIRLESRSAAGPLARCYDKLPLGLRCAVLRYARSMDRTGTGELARLLMDDAEAAIRQPARTVWAGTGTGRSA